MRSLNSSLLVHVVHLSLRHHDAVTCDLNWQRNISETFSDKYSKEQLKVVLTMYENIARCFREDVCDEMLAKLKEEYLDIYTYIMEHHPSTWASSKKPRPDWGRVTSNAVGALVGCFSLHCKLLGLLSGDPHHSWVLVFNLRAILCDVRGGQSCHVPPPGAPGHHDQGCRPVSDFASLFAIYCCVNLQSASALVTGCWRLFNSYVVPFCQHWSTLSGLRGTC